MKHGRMHFEMATYATIMYRKKSAQKQAENIYYLQKEWNQDR